MENERFYEWTVKIRVTPDLVAEGYNLNDLRLRQMLERSLPFAHGSQFEAEIVSAPPPDDIAKEQGYPSAAVAEMVRRR